MEATAFAEVAEDLRSAAFAVGNGELLWRPAAAREVAEWLAAKDVAVLGGEIYRTGLTVGWGTYVTGWEMDPPWARTEPWSDFVERCRQEALAALGTDLPAETLVFLAVCEEHDYDRQWYGPNPQ
jgi:hypothetical protein